MTQLIKTRKNGGFPSLRNDYYRNRFFTPRLFDLDLDFFEGGLNAPPANITETDKEYRLDLSVPGMTREDFDVDIENGVLTISSEKEEERKEDDKNFRRREFSYNSFSRTFPLPDNVDENNIRAKYDNGMLQVTIPKTETTILKPKKQIKVS
jgi:HSP20 family protein